MPPGAPSAFRFPPGLDHAVAPTRQKVLNGRHARDRLAWDSGGSRMTSNASGEPRAGLNAQPPSSGSQAVAPYWQPCPQRPLLDRRSERTGIDDLLGLIRQGMSGVLVLRGHHGVGKTTLLDYAVGAASEFRISSIAGVYSEINLPYGGLHQLLIPFLPLIDDLPAPQRQALRIAFGLEAGPPPERFFVGLACLTLLSRAAMDQPVLGAIDDAPWIADA